MTRFEYLDLLLVCVNIEYFFVFFSLIFFIKCDKKFKIFFKIITDEHG